MTSPHVFGAGDLALIAGGLAVYFELFVWYRRLCKHHGWAPLPAPVVIVGLSLAGVVIDLGRVAWFVGRLAAEWLVAPDVTHARARWANRTILRRKTPVAPPPIYTAGAVLAQAGIDHAKVAPALAATPDGAVLIAPHGVTEDGRLLYEAVN